MDARKDGKRGISRRAFMRETAATTLALGAGGLGGVGGARQTLAQASDGAATAGPDGRPYNILFILTDQERYMTPEELPPGFALPGRARLARRGVTFTNHQINAAVCTPSRSNIYTGQHIQHTRLFDNMDFAWVDDLSHDLPTVGTMLGEAGYYVAYKGKWHMSKALGTQDELALPQERLSAHLAGYGFYDYVGIGDAIGHTHGGFINDDTIGTQARRWLRVRGQPMDERREPWMLAVNLINPHDVMFYNTDAPGERVQETPPPLMEIAREPSTPHYRRQWDVPLPATRNEPFDKPGRPPAHEEYQNARAALVGRFPNEDARWRRLINYYFNCILETDRIVGGILDELEDLGLADNTIVVLTADHGELAGAHGTHGKGATAYREQNHVPMIVAHPGVPRTHGQACRAVTSHLDLAPSFLGWTGADPAARARIGRALKGRDMTPLLEKGAVAGLNDLRPATLYCFNMFFYLDSAMTRQVQDILNAGNTREVLRTLDLRPDFTRRGAIRSVYDGRYKFSRYFSPKQFNQPSTLEGIFALNDVELFDLEADPQEVRNLAREPKRNGALLLAMNDKMNALIEEEVGEPDDGRFLPADEGGWTATRFSP